MLGVVILSFPVTYKNMNILNMKLDWRGLAPTRSIFGLFDCQDSVNSEHTNVTAPPATPRIMCPFRWRLYTISSAWVVREGGVEMRGRWKDPAKWSLDPCWPFLKFKRVFGLRGSTKYPVISVGHFTFDRCIPVMIASMLWTAKLR